jgi:hypothetical protein
MPNSQGPSGPSSKAGTHRPEYVSIIAQHNREITDLMAELLRDLLINPQKTKQE